MLFLKQCFSLKESAIMRRRRQKVGLTPFRCKLEEKTFRIGDAVEAMWIGDGGFYPGEDEINYDFIALLSVRGMTMTCSTYPGTVEGYLAGNNYDIKWTDPQGLADTQVTPAESVRKFDPAVYYRYGLNALKQDDLQSAYLAFRCLMVIQGGFGDAEAYLKQLLDVPDIKQFALSRGDGDISSYKPRKPTPKVALQDAEQDSKDQLYTNEELEDLREEAAADQVKRDMWRQHNQFVAQHAGLWHGLWTDFELRGVRP